MLMLRVSNPQYCLSIINKEFACRDGESSEITKYREFQHAFQTLLVSGLNLWQHCFSFQMKRRKTAIACMKITCATHSLFFFLTWHV
mmetsp:Transcript_140689/g.269882  ORF Transcript_140689/g.269882 Transcript_140689/m.269882 type:complete len:87 (-) Transcript_140689:25-285(-)